MNRSIISFALLLLVGLTIAIMLMDGTSTPIAMDIQGRADYMKMLLADPITGEIPKGARAAELAFARKFDTYNGRTDAKITTDSWNFAGPINVGGRTRAIGIDVANENILLAAGVSSGMFKSSDRGAHWQKTFSATQLQSVSCLCQDTRPGKTSRWYAGTGEFYGNSSDLNGDGIYVSDDNGDSWKLLSASQTATPQSWDGAYEYVYDIATDNSNLNQDELYVATALGGIYRSTDGGKSFRTALGGLGNQYSLFTDIAITSTGVIYAAMSQIGGGGATSKVKGIWRSTDGISWVNITPANFPEQYYRIVIEINPLNENQVYFFGHTPNSGKRSVNFRGDIEWNSLWQYRYVSGDGKNSGGSWENRSNNLPALGGAFGDIITQQGYDLVLKVHPKDTNVLFVGGTNLYRSTSAFTNANNTTWIGGYMPETKLPYFDVYPNQHPDQHALLFLPSNPQIAISANDGGIQITNNCLSSTLEWSSLNNGYCTSQFYTIAVDHGKQQRSTIIGGLQDNGTYHTYGKSTLDPWSMKLTYDGAFCAIDDDNKRYYMSAQQGRIGALTIAENGEITSKGRIDPIGAKNYLFINPFTLDENNKSIMYLAGGSILWRNSNLYEIPLGTWDSTSVNWDSLPATRLPDDEQITSVSSSMSPAHKVYYGTSKGRLFSIDNAHSGNPTPVNITGSKFSTGTIQSIAIDPRDANNVMVVFSNYNVISLFYTANGGESWIPVAGNLEENPSGSGAGPSCRWAEIVPVEDKTLFYVGTSIGLFSTSVLDSSYTCWQQEGASTIGNAVVTMIDIRLSDGFMAVATHGSGVFTTKLHDIPSQVAAPALMHPANDTVSAITSIKYQWNQAPGTVFSQLEVSEVPDFSTITFKRSLIANGIYTGSSLLKTNKRYYWRVFGVNSAGLSASSEVRTFRVGTLNSVPDTVLSSIQIAQYGDALYVYSMLYEPLYYRIFGLDGSKCIEGYSFENPVIIDIRNIPNSIYFLNVNNSPRLSKSFIINK